MSEQAAVSKPISVLMVGPGRNVKGGISTVINSYYALGLDKQIVLKYIASMEEGSTPRKIWIAIRAYFQFCFSIKKSDVVHIHMAAQASYTRKSMFVQLAHKAGKKVIIHSHAADFDDFFFKQSGPKKRKRIRHIFSLADKVITLSEEWAKFFSNSICSPEKIVVLHNAVILPNYKKTNYDDHRILFLGRLGERKGTYDLLKVIPDVLDAVPDAEFILGGDGDVKKCIDITQKSGIEGHVRFLGWVNEKVKERCLEQCSIFALPSYHEGLPMSLLEAMSYHCAVVTTKVGGIPAVVRDKENGLLIDAGNTEELKAAIVQLLQNKGLKEELSEKGFQSIQERFQGKENLQRLVALYSQVVEHANTCNMAV